MKDPLADSCLDCPAGFYCVNDKSQDPEPCPLGFFCPVKTGFNWRPCPKGTYGDRPGLSNVTSKYLSSRFYEYRGNVVNIIVTDTYALLCKLNPLHP